MNNEELAKKLAGFIGTTTVLTLGAAGFLTTGSNCIPNYTHQSSYHIDLSQFNLANPYEVRITLKSEDTVTPNDPPIPIAVVGKMAFRFGQPEQKKFSI